MRTPWYWGWNVLVASVLVQGFTFGLLYISFALWVAPFMEAFGANRAEVMLAIMFTQIGGAMAYPLVGQALDSLPIRFVMSAGVVSFACGLAALTLTTAMWQVSAIYMTLMALGMTLAGPMASQTLATRWFRGNRGLAIGIATAGTSVGGAVMPLLAAWLIASLGWRTANLALAGLALVFILPLALLLIRNSPDELGLAIEPGPDIAANPALEGVWSYGRIFAEPNLWVTMAAFVPSMIVMSGFQMNIASYAADLAISPQGAATLISALSIAMIASKLLFGALADRVDHRRLYFTGMAMMIASLALFTLQLPYALLLGVSVLLGAGMGSMLPLVGAIVSTSFGAGAFGRVLGLIYTSFAMAAFGAPIAGAVRDQLGDYDPFLFAGMAVIAVCASSIFRLRQPLRPAPVVTG